MRGDGTETPARGLAHRSRWVLLPAGLLAALAFLAVLQGLSARPSGAAAGLDLPGFVLPRLRGDVLVVALLASLAQVPLLVLRPRARRAAAGALFVLLGAAGTALLVATVADAEVYRYISERLDLFMLSDYRMERDPTFTGRILLADAPFLGPALAIVVAFVAAAVRLAFRFRDDDPPRGAVLASLLALIASRGGFALAPVPAETWRQAQPPGWRLVRQVVAPPAGASKMPDGFSESLPALQAFLGKPPGWFANRLYPLWHEAADEEASYARFRARPPLEKPDVVLVFFESLRGWEADFRDASSATRFPSLHRLFRERGTEFVNFQSNGFPSVEGWTSLSLGLWPHPRHIMMGNDTGKRFLSLPEVLGRAGYWRAIVSPEPWGEISPWYRRWYDELSLGMRGSDADMARRFVELYDAAPAGRPRMLTWVTVSTHPPFVPPPGVVYPGAPGDRQQYLAAAAETDRVLGAILDHLRSSGRWDRTIVLVTGDHSTSNGWIALRTPRLGTPNAGETWTPLVWAAPGAKGGAIDERVRSHVDIPPTLLAALGLDVSNHFLGRDLFDPSVPEVPVLALHFDGVAVTRGSFRYHFRLDDPAFFRKFRWDVKSPPTPEDGSYRHGEELAATAEERAEMARIGRLASAYGYLVYEDRIAPPKGGASGPRPTPRTPDARRD